MKRHCLEEVLKHLQDPTCLCGEKPPECLFDMGRDLVDSPEKSPQGKFLIIVARDFGSSAAPKYIEGNNYKFSPLDFTNAAKITEELQTNKFNYRKFSDDIAVYK